MKERKNTAASIEQRLLNLPRQRVSWLNQGAAPDH